MVTSSGCASEADCEGPEYEARGCDRLVQSLLDGMESATCIVDRHGDVLAFNEAWRGHPAGAAGIGTRAVTAPPMSRGLTRVLSGELDRFTLDHLCAASTGGRWFSLRITALPEIAGAMLCHVDISAVEPAGRPWFPLSLHDALTDLPNRDLLEDRILGALAQTGSPGVRVAVAVLGVDGFRRVNDCMGHRGGDQLLREVAERLSVRLRGGDTLSRWAGDEFVAVWPGVESVDEAQALAEQLLGAFDAPFEFEGQSEPLLLTASVGLVVGAAPQTADGLLFAADMAMSDAKSHGRGRVRMYSERLREAADQRLREEAELREGLARGELELHYQPVVDLVNDVVTGVEALVRWRRPDGLRMPDTFIPLAEATGLIEPMGAWVLEEACRQGARWAAQGLHLDIAVNLSARQLSRPTIVGTIEGALRSSGLPPGRLLVEVTESTMMEDEDAAQAALAAIARLGVSVAIDDFGTGYSSLVYLKRYTIQALKVDRSFVAGLGANADDDAIVASIVNLARAVGAVCIAEGVETPEQLGALVSLGCDFAQGFLFARPVPAEELPAALEVCARVAAKPPVRAPTAVTRRLPPLLVADLDRTRHRVPGGGPR